MRRFHRSLRYVAAVAVTLTAAAASSARAQDSQPVIDAKSAAFFRDRYLADLDTVHVKIMALAEAIPEDKYSWRPACARSPRC